MTRFLIRSGMLSLLALLMGFVSSSVSRAECGYTVSTNDTTWTFQANSGSEQTRTITIHNTSNDAMVFEISVTGSEAFTATPHLDTLAAGETLTVSITFKAGPNVAPGTVAQSKLAISKVGGDCHNSIGLIGKVSGSNSGGDLVVVFDPGKFSFGALTHGSDSCHTFTVYNRTGKEVILSGWAMLHDYGFRVDPSYTSDVTIDSGESKQFTVCFTADSNHQEVHDSLNLSWHFDNQTEVHHSYLAVAGACKSSSNGGGKTAGVSADPHEYSFGALAVGTTACKEIVITNTSSSSNVTITGYNSCENTAFSITPAFNGNKLLQPGGSMTIKVCYTAGDAGSSAKCSLTLNYNTDNPSTDGNHLVIPISGSALSNSGGHDACLQFEQGEGTKDPIVLGASANRNLQLINRSGADIVITTDSLACEDAHAFTLTGQLPITVSAHSTVNFPYTFTPFAQANGNPKELYSACIYFGVSGDSISCEHPVAKIIGLSHHDNDTHSTDTIVRPLYPSEPRTIIIESHGDRPTKTFTFTNNLDVDVTVNGISLAQGQFFQIQSASPSATPFTLKPDEQMTVTIVYTANDKNVHYDTLLINSTHNLVASGFELQGVQAATSSVRGEIPAGVTISLTPNPMSSKLTATITGARNATIEVYDMLGKQLTSAPISGVWSWNATTDGGSHIAAGSYIVRISGVSADGVVFVTSKRLVVTND